MSTEAQPTHDELKDKLAEAIQGNHPHALSIALDLIELLENEKIDLTEQLRKAKVARYFGGELQDYKDDTSRLYQGPAKAAEDGEG